MNKDRQKVLLIDDRRWFWAQQITEALIVTLAPILIGVLVGSVPMQWIGFVFGVLLLCGWAIKGEEKHTFDNADEAMKHLQKLKSKEQG